MTLLVVNNIKIMEDVEPMDEDEVIVGQSPTPIKDVVLVEEDEDDKMDFFSALDLIKEGNKVTKLEWGDEGYYGFLKGELLKLHKPDGKEYDWIISLGDIEGTDYIIVE